MGKIANRRPLKSRQTGWARDHEKLQLRMLLLITVEGARMSPADALFNELPDRIEGSRALSAAGYGAARPQSSWAAALLARPDGCAPICRAGMHPPRQLLLGSLSDFTATA